MSDIANLESRITSALERIRAGLTSASDVGDEGALATQLSEEQTANAQLQERVKALKERQDTKLKELEDRVDAQRAQMSQLDGELQRLRASNADMREVSAQLRAAASEGVAEPELLNRAMMAEVEALAAQRSADASEVDAIIAELKPLIAEA